MPDIHDIWQVLLSAEWRRILLYGSAGAIAGAFAMPILVFIAMRTNQDHIRDLYKASRIPESVRLYGLFALSGAALFGIISASQPVLDAAGEDEIYVRAALLVFIMLVLAPPFVRALRRLRDGD